MEKSDRCTTKKDTPCKSDPISPREKDFWQEQELIKHDNRLFEKRHFWTRIKLQDDLKRKLNKRVKHIRPQRQRNKDHEIESEILKAKKERKELIKNAIDIIKPSKKRWRQCCRELIYEIADIGLQRSNTLRWTKEDHLAAVSLEKALKKARNEARKLPDWQANQILFHLTELLANAEGFAKTPFHNGFASRLTRTIAAARTKKASAEEVVAS